MGAAYLAHVVCTYNEWECCQHAHTQRREYRELNLTQTYPALPPARFNMFFGNMGGGMGGGARGGQRMHFNMGGGMGGGWDTNRSDQG